MNHRFCFRNGCLVALWLLSASRLLADDDLILLEEQAMRAAVARVAPSVVKIETVGGLEKVGQLLVGTGPTTGLIVSDDGYILSSAFNFVQQPTSILVTLADGSRHAAKRVATDHSRLLVLLKIDVDKPLPAAEAAPESEILVGTWAIAVGRTYEGAEPNISVGIVSAVQRIWGKVIQTDAKISPSNYGGPLIDIQGRVQGVLTPMSPQAADEVAGVELYDSGIGFAVPLASMLNVLPRLRTGNDLHAGILGINLRGTDQFVDPAVIAAARPNSPAYNAGLKADDRIIECDGHPVTRQTQLKQIVGSRYAGDKIRLVVLRGEERLEKDLELIAKLEPYVHPFLGLLPLRDSAAGGVAIRYVYEESPAAKAGVAPGDVLISVDGTEIVGYASLLERLAPLSAGDVVHCQFLRDGERRDLELKTASLPESVPEELPPALRAPPAAEGQLPAVGRLALKLPESTREAIGYVPESYQQGVPHAVVIRLNANGIHSDKEAEELLALWKPACDAQRLIFIAPRSLDQTKWDPAKDAPEIRKLVDHVRGIYSTDPARVVVVGQAAGTPLAIYLAMNNRDLVRGVASLDAPPAGQIADNEPVYRQAFWFAKAEKASTAKALDLGVKRLRDLKYPVTVRELGDAPRELSNQDFASLLRWIDTLDRF